MAKIANDKYYTPQHIVELVIQRTKEVIGLENITEFIEPSAGNGAFLDKLYELGKPVYAYDLYPEDNRIVEQDYLKLDLAYKVGRCVVGNPPFGYRGNLFRQFYNKSVEEGDYIVYIGSIKLLNNTGSLYKFDLIYSEDLGNHLYTDRYIHCSLNIYKRPINKELNKKLSIDIKDVIIVADDNRSKQYLPLEEDFKICRMGAKTWKVLDEGQQLRNFKIVVMNKEIIPKIKEIFNTKYYERVNGLNNTISTPYIVKHDIYKCLREQMPELE